MKIADNRVASLKGYFQEKLRDYFSPGEVEVMLHECASYLLGLDRTAMILEADRRLSESELLQIHRAIDELRKGKPLQYVCGYTSFLDLKIKVDERVLIPRPETEELCEWMREDLEKFNQLQVLDLCSGSGCISLALAQVMPQHAVSGCDVSEGALALAKENAEENDLPVRFFKWDLLGKEVPEEKWDVFVSNPPYVLEKEKESMEKNVLEYEPHLALFVSDDDPLLFYRKIAELGRTHLSEKGVIYFELNEAYAHETGHLLEEMGWNWELRQDINERQRMIKAWKA